MDHYIEIRLLPDPEFPDTVLMNALFAKFHRALVEVGQGEIGVSFPKAQKKMGDVLRIHGNQQALQRLMSLGWLKGLRDYAEVSALLPTPRQCRYKTVKRVQPKSSVGRLYRRSVRKGWVTTEEASQKVSTSRPEKVDLPFVQLKSHSTGENFRLFIQQGEPGDSPEKGQFSSYGLSSVATVPWF